MIHCTYYMPQPNKLNVRSQINLLCSNSVTSLQLEKENTHHCLSEEKSAMKIARHHHSHIHHYHPTTITVLTTTIAIMITMIIMITITIMITMITWFAE